jgi:hypothetical protein
MDAKSLPELPLAAWKDTKTTLHLFSQMVGKIRLQLHPRLNHWWHVPFYVSARGLTTGAMPTGNRILDLEFDLTGSRLVLRVSSGETASVSLLSQSSASFYKEVMEKLSGLGIRVRIHAVPFDPAKVGSSKPFAADTDPRAYDSEYAIRFFRILAQVEPVFREFRGRFLGKCSPVHFFWHSFDLAVTRFSGRAVPVSPDADPVTREAYSHEVISAGFWPGDDNVPAPAFYSYAAPQPEGLAEEPIKPEAAGWNVQNGNAMAGFMYDDLRQLPSPREALLEFLQSTYEAGAKRANWPRKELERAPG